jgi:pimeloyl-ACP methyl ester carboxylesterase
VIDATLVTIHGFWSSPATWERLNEVWRADEELRGMRIHPFGYPSPKKPRVPLSVTRVPDYDDIAQILSTEYATVLANASDIAVVTHSQGGLILQRFLAWMVSEGRARDLSRIRSVVMLACPNGGSEYLESLRRTLGYGRHPQAAHLNVLDRQVADTQRTVLQRIVNAAGVDDHQCRIPFHVYAGGSDDIVKAASAQAAFPGASTIAGNHFTILHPAAPGNRTADTVKHHVLADVAAPRARPGAVPAPETTGEPEPAADKRTDGAKYVVNVYGTQGLQMGDGNVQQNVFSGDNQSKKLYPAMFADLIAQGHSMISRLERLTGLSYEQLKAIPDEQQVSWQETQEWKNEATRRVHEAFGDRADARLELQYKLWQEDVESGKGDEVSRVLTYHRRVVSILQELQEIVSA